MDTAFLLLSACAVALHSGWQPAADDPNAYEYSIAIDPQTAADLAAGKVTELEASPPADLGQIRRIRIQVGGDRPQRQRSVVALKPPLPDHLRLTQAASPSAAGRYATTGGGDFDPYAAQPSADQLFAGGTAAAPRYPGAPGSAPTAADYGRAAAQQLGDAATQAGNQWQTQVQSQWDTQVDAGVQQATRPIRTALGRLDHRLRSAVENLGDRSRDVLQGATAPLQGQGLFRTNAAPGQSVPNWGAGDWAPPLMPPTPAATAPVATTPTTAWPDRAPAPTPANPWGATPASGNIPTPAPGWDATPYAGSPTPATGPAPGAGAWPTTATAGTPPNTPRSSYPRGYGQPTTPTTPGRERIDQAIDPRDAGQWHGATQPTGPIVEVGGDRYGHVAGNGQPAPGSTPATQPGRPYQPAPAPSTWPVTTTAGGTPSAWPPATTPTPTTPTQPDGGRPTTPWPADWPRVAQRDPGANTQPGETPQVGSGPRFPDFTTTADVTGGGPAITGAMLEGPATTPLNNAEGTRPPTDNSGWPAITTGGTIPLNGGEATAPPATAPPADTPSASDLGWDNLATADASDAPPAANPRNVIPVIVAWTLLFSSVAGNAYLLWSYLDVRTKYRTQVRRNGSGVRSRFSAA